MSMKTLSSLAVLACALLVTSNSAALPAYLTVWKARYGADSPVDDNNLTECQICHVSSGGGSAAGWNGYGWRIRQLLNAGTTPPTVDDAIIQAGISDADGDSANAISITEIQNGHHPGWADGNQNIYYLPSGNTQGGNTAPALVANDIDLDPATPLENPIAERIARGPQRVSLETIASGFTSPLLAVPAPSINDVLFVVDQVGIIWRVSLADGAKTRYFDISSGASTSEAMASNLVTVGNAGFGPFDERGLLGLAFHPNFAANGKFYTYQSETDTGTPFVSTMPNGVDPDHQTVIAEWTVSNPSESAPVIGNKRELLRIDQPQFNHDGGMLAFDDNGLLYISLGDGGSRDDEDVAIEQPGGGVSNSVQGHGSGNGSDPSNPLGAILRIDPDGNNSANGQYGIPAANPFDGSGVELAEIYAYGLRNVYRFSFDSQTGELYAADVGQGDIEEINLIEAGGNYGWNQKEGSFWFYPNGRSNGYVSNEAPSNPAPSGLTDPLLQYDHDDGISVTGGYVYRGTQLPSLDGTYIFADWSTDFGTPLGRLFYSDDKSSIREFVLTGQANVGLFVTGFGQDQQGEVYVLGNTTGNPFGMTGVLQKIVEAVEEDEFCVPIKTQNGAVSVICL